MNLVNNQTSPNPAKLSNAGVGGLPKTLGFNGRLTEEEKYFVIIRVFTLWDPKRTYKLWFWRTKPKMPNISYTEIFFSLSSSCAKVLNPILTHTNGSTYH